MSETLLSVTGLDVVFRPSFRQRLAAVDGVDLEVRRGETLGLVGESGCGKSSLGRAIVGLEPHARGRIVFEGEDLTQLSERELRRRRSGFQMIFQNPQASLNPRRRVGEIVAEGLEVLQHGTKEDRQRIAIESLESVGLAPETYLGRRAHELSGGQCQRVCIARALAVQPRLLVCDEPVSSLDVSVQAQILNLLRELKARHHLTMVFISHDLAVVRNVCDTVAVMYLGKVCEIAPVERFYEAPAHPYSVALLRAVPTTKAGQRPEVLSGEIPSALSPPTGCRFRTRCPRAEPRCAEHLPNLTHLDSNHAVACHFPHFSQ